MSGHKALIYIAMLMLVGSATAQGRPGTFRRRMSQAIAVASANAQPGATVNSVSSATSTGSPTSSVVQASGSGEGTVVDCQQAAQNGQQLTKECTGPSGGAAASGWASAPQCQNNPSSSTVTYDQQGNPWGWEDNQSCAYRDNQGKPTVAAQAQAKAQAGRHL